jgi:hypothetical protein
MPLPYASRHKYFNILADYFALGISETLIDTVRYLDNSSILVSFSIARYVHDCGVFSEQDLRLLAHVFIGMVGCHQMGERFIDILLST